MSAFKIECPHCSQRIECDERYCGIQLKCPACQGDMMIPHLPSAAAPAPVAAGVAAPAPEMAPPPRNVVRLAPTPAAAAAPTPQPSIRVVQTTPARAAAAPPSHPVPTPRPISALAADNDDGPGMSKGKKIGLIATLVVIVPAVGYLAFSQLGKMQSKFNEERAKDDDPGLIGGQVGHIAELNSVLAATDPARFETKAVEGPQWTLDVAAAKYPQGDVRGLISGHYFSQVDTTLSVGNGGIMLAFTEGTEPPYERSLSFTTLMKAGESLDGKTWTMSKDDPAGATTVTKQWLDRNGGGRQQRSYKSGFALKVELGKPSGGYIPGKVFVSVPDSEKTVVAGNFTASIRALGAPQASGQGRRPQRPAAE